MSGSWLVWSKLGSRSNLPCCGIDGTNGGAGDVSIMQRLNVEIKAFDIVQPVGQGTQKFREMAQRRLRFRHADRLEAESTPGGRLCKAAEIGRDHGSDIGGAAAGAAGRHQPSRVGFSGYLDAAVHGAVGNDVVPVQMLYHGALEPIAHAV